MHTCPGATQQMPAAAFHAACRGDTSLQSYKLYRKCCFRTKQPVVQRTRTSRGSACVIYAKTASTNGAQLVPAKRAAVSEKEGPSTDFKVIWSRLWKVCSNQSQRLLKMHTQLIQVLMNLQLTLPYWTKSEDATKAKWKLAGVVLLTLGTTGVRQAQHIVVSPHTDMGYMCFQAKAA